MKFIKFLCILSALSLLAFGFFHLDMYFTYRKAVSHMSSVVAGMTKSEVENILGAPDGRVVNDQLPEGERQEKSLVWEYYPYEFHFDPFAYVFRGGILFTPTGTVVVRYDDDMRVSSIYVSR